MSEILHQESHIDGPNSSTIAFDIRVTEGTDKLPLIIICHGFKGFKTHSFFPYLAENLASAGYVTIVMNFSHNGVEGEEFTQLDRFKDNTIALEQEDIKLLLDAVYSDAIPLSDRINKDQITLVGHSRGAATVILYAAEDPRIKALATLAGVSQQLRVSDEEANAWREAGVHYILNARTKQELPLGIGLLDEFLNNPDAVENAARKLNQPLLAVHGAQDTSVPAICADLICSWAPNSQKIILEGADHTFGVSHPFSGETGSLKKCVVDLINFLGK